MKGKKLILFTHGFPYGKGEQFLEAEVVYLSKVFEQVLIYSTLQEGDKRDLPKNVEVKTFVRGQAFSVKSLLFRRMMLFIAVFLKEFWSFKRKKYYKGDFEFHFNNLLGIVNDAERLQEELDKYDLKSVQLYSYWFGPWGDVLAALSAISKGRLSFLTRIHGHDYDVDRREHKFIPFRAFFMHHVRAIVSVSMYGKTRVSQEYPFYKKSYVSRLGVQDAGVNPFSESVGFHIVSCSSLIPLKRVHLIVAIIEKLPFTVRWTHFGDGPLFEEVKGLASLVPENVTVDLKGFVSNEEIIEFYKNTPIDLFINVSEHEGIPVSIMEAISFGIPSIGCAICGVPEIVTKKTGFILDKEFEVADAVDILVGYEKGTAETKQELRKTTRAYWKENFSAEENYTDFINQYLLNNDV